ncbi:hypothetical protein GCM10007870_24030 [Gluconobacter kondonii]|uniref:Integrase n=1 Tax=Gluconobacter kondonii TaxID=941463 RepID=A0ABQ5WTE7_9PROT|nr:hypothetical protein GCM10007870_24030 [Gluconobacter kondonii]
MKCRWDGKWTVRRFNTRFWQPVVGALRKSADWEEKGAQDRKWDQRIDHRKLQEKEYIVVSDPLTLARSS